MLSCCYSLHGYSHLRKPLRNHFTGCYYFAPKKIGFSDAITTWAMFYKHKTIKQPHAAVVQKINDFFDGDVIKFGAI